MQFLAPLRDAPLSCSVLRSSAQRSPGRGSDGAAMRAPRPHMSAGGRGYTGAGSPMREMTVYGVSFDLVGKQPIVPLKTSDGDKVLPV